MSHMCPTKASENQELISAIWGLSGDIHILLTQRAAHLEMHREDFVHQREEDKAIWESARLELGSAGMWVKLEKHNSMDQTLSLFKMEKYETFQSLVCLIRKLSWTHVHFVRLTLATASMKYYR